MAILNVIKCPYCGNDEDLIMHDDKNSFLCEACIGAFGIDCADVEQHNLA